MTLTASSRSCRGCGRLLPSAPPHVCAVCDRVAVPPLEEWSTDLRMWLAGQQMRQAFNPHRRGAALARWCALLTGVIAGKRWGERMVPQAVSAEDAYRIACAETEKWVAAGRPELYE